MLDNHVSLEESLAERLCTAAGCGLLVPPYFPLRLLHHYHHHHSNLGPPPHAALSCPHSTMVTVARQLPPYSASVLGNWPVAQWSAFARSSQLRRLLPPHVSAQLPPTPLTHTSSFLPLLGNTFRHLCLSGISLARVGEPRPAALVFVGSEGRRAVRRTDGINYWIS